MFKAQSPCSVNTCSVCDICANKKITGKVLDEESKPLSGVSVTIKGKQTGTQTNANGEYSIDAAEGDVLIFSFTGLSTREVRVGTTSIIDITLDAKVGQMEEVVVTVYGTQKKSNWCRCNS